MTVTACFCMTKILLKSASLPQSKMPYLIKLQKYIIQINLVSEPTFIVFFKRQPRVHILLSHHVSIANKDEL